MSAVTYRPSYTIKAVAADLGISPRAVRRLIDAGHLPSFKPSGMNVRLIKGVDLAAYVARQPTTGGRAEPAPVAPGAPSPFVVRRAG